MTWTFTVVNTGNVTLTDVAVTDSKAGAVTCERTTLAPGDVHRVRVGQGTRRLVRRHRARPDRERGHRDRATADRVAGHQSAGPGRASRPPLPFRGCSWSRSATLHDSNGNGRGDLGETISYTFLVVNVGNATATDVHLDDSMFGGPIACTPSTLKPAPVLRRDRQG